MVRKTSNGMNRITTLVIVVAVLLLIGWFVWPGWGDRDGINLNGTPTVSPTATVTATVSPTATASPTLTVSPSPTVSPTMSPTTSPNPDGTMTLSGELRASSDPARGNYLFVSGSNQIYIRTARDFSSLVGKQVEVTISGTLESFVLVDIKEK